MLRGLKQNLIHTRRTLRDGARCAFECLNVSYRGTGHSGLPQGQGLWVQHTWVWHKPSCRRSPLTASQSHQNLHRTGETDSWRAQTKPRAHQDPRERSSDPTRDCPRLARECPGVSGGGVGWWWSGAGSGALSAAVRAWDLLKEVNTIFIASTVVWPRVKQQEGNTAHQEKIRLNIY